MKEKAMAEERRSRLPAASSCWILLIESGIREIHVLFIHLFACQLQGLANTINMKWILKEPPTAFMNDIFQYAQHYCAYLKVPLLLPYSLIYEVMRLFFTDFLHCSLFSKAKSPPVNRFLVSLLLVHTEVMHI